MNNADIQHRGSRWSTPQRRIAPAMRTASGRAQALCSGTITLAASPPPRPPGWSPQLVMLHCNTIANCVLIPRIGAHEGDGDGTLANAWTTGANPAPGGCVSAASLRAAVMLAWLAAPAPALALAQDNVVATATLPRDLSPWGMYLNADPVVKAVLIGLALASIVTWTVWLAKTIEIVLAKRRVRA